MDTEWISIANILKSGNKVKYCSAPETLHKSCSSKIIDAHTLSRSLTLKPISFNSEVMAVNTNPFTLADNLGSLTFEKIGISKASVFTGFCSIHDNAIFSPIENGKFYPSLKNLFLQAYRICCMEHFKKVRVVKNQEKIRCEFERKIKSLSNSDDIDDFERLSFESILSKKEMLEMQGLDDTKKIKDKFDQIYLSEEFSRLRHLVFEIEDNNIVAGSSILLEKDFNNNELQDLNDLDKDEFIVFNCISIDEKKGFVFFSWLQENELAKRFADSLIGKDLKEDILVEFLFSYSENIFSNPLWWDGLPERARKSLEKKANEMAAASRDLSVPKESYGSFRITNYFYL